MHIKDVWMTCFKLTGTGICGTKYGQYTKQVAQVDKLASAVELNTFSTRFETIGAEKSCIDVLKSVAWIEGGGGPDEHLP